MTGPAQPREETQPQPAARPAPALVSVLIPVRDGAATIGEQLEALSRQTYRGRFEVVVADNGSTDETVAVAEAWADRLPLRVVDVSARPGSSYARNAAAAQAEGEFLAFCDADDVVVPGWLEALVGAAADVDAVTGPQDVTVVNPLEIQSWRSDRPRNLPRGRFLPYAPSCNLGVWADVWARTGGFREEYPQAHDVDWSWRMQEASFRLGFAPDAVVHYRYRSSLRGVAKQAWATGIDTARLYRDHRGAGYPRRPLRRALRTWLWLVVRAPAAAVSRRWRGTWVRRAGESAGRLAGSLRFRVLAL